MVVSRLLVLRVELSDGAQVTIHASRPLTTITLEELLAHLAVYEWIVRRREARDKNQALALSIVSWWRAGREPAR